MHGPVVSRLSARLSGACAACLCSGALLLSWPVLAVSQPSAPGAAAPQPHGKASGTRVAQAGVRSETRPAWSELGTEQRSALQPLAGTWSSLSEAQKRKWIAISRNFDRMTPDEKAKLHSRMNEWVALSPQQRAQARLNFGETRNLSPDDRKAKWEAYQALSPEEKRKLAAGAKSHTPPTAAAVRPVPAQKLANVPRPERGSKPPRIANGDAQAPPLEPGGAD